MGDANGGTLLHDAIETAHGEAGESPLRALYIGTLAPGDGRDGGTT